MPSSLTLEYELRHWSNGIRWLAGVDECGRGPLAGPVVCGAIVLSPDADPTAFSDVNASKLLSAKRVREIATRVRQNDYPGLVAWGLGAASPREIDRFNVRRATALAMKRAIDAAQRHLARKIPGSRIEHVILDGTPLPELAVPHDAIVRGDRRSISIALAACLAVDCRRTLMSRLADRYPAFACWKNDYGYPSPAHLEAIRRHGPIKGVHRMSFSPVSQGSLF